MTTEPGFDRCAVVIYPTRANENALAARRQWTDDRSIELVQVGTGYGLIGATALGSSADSMAVGGLGMAAGIAGLRRRRRSADISRIFARDARAAHLAAEMGPAQ